MKHTLLLLFISLIILSGCSQEDTWSFNSPDENISVILHLSEGGQLEYSAQIVQNGDVVTAIEPSLLGVDRDDGTFVSGLTFVGQEQRSVREDYQLVTGKKRDITYEAEENKFIFMNVAGDRMEVIFRVFNDGLAFMYHFPGETTTKHTITKDYSSFNLPDEGTCWSQAYDTVTMWTPAYETFYERSMPIGTSAPANKNGWSFPTTFHTQGIWVLITESNLDGTYPACHLQPDCENGIYTIRFPEEEEAYGKFSNKPASTLPWSTPWRVAVIGSSAGDIVESTIVTDLADPSKLDDTSWIEPGRAAWSWWSDSPSPQFVREQNRFTDLALEMGWEYNLIDANWNEMKDGHVKDAIDYAVSKEIGPILWYNSGGAHNIVTEAPRDRMWDPEIREKEFSKISAWGVRGVKVDFFQSDKQAIINQYLGILEDAAKHQVMVNFHGCTLPRGWNRTWPNMVTLEAVRGGEVYKFGKDYPAKATWHNTVLPFTRNVVGPMDYTPVMLTDHNYPHLTTYAHELATSVVFESGIIHMADKVEAYLGLPDPARNFLKQVPAAWDEIKFIDGYPGEFVILARRHHETWYVAGLNGNDEGANWTFNLSFLDEGTYNCKMIMDGDDDNSFSFTEKEVANGDELTVSTLPYGGFALTITAL